LDETENLNLRSLSLTTPKPRASPPKQHWRASPTDSTVRRKEAKGKKATRKKALSLGEEELK
jgi:hypothetical protein